MKFSIIGPTQKKELKINWLKLETLKGKLVIQPGHKYSYIVIKPESEIEFEEVNGTIQKFKIANAFLEVKRNEALIILDR